MRGIYRKLVHKKPYSWFLLSVGDYKRLDTSLYFMITNFHMELKPQVKSAMA